MRWTKLTKKPRTLTIYLQNNLKTWNEIIGINKYEIYFISLLQMDSSQPPEKFWVKNPCDLFSSGSIFPTQNKTINKNLNSLTRLALVIAIIMAAFGNKQWIFFLAAAILLIVLLKYGGRRATPEYFTRTPTYVSDDFHQTVVPPLYAEEWQIPPPRLRYLRLGCAERYWIFPRAS